MFLLFYRNVGSQGGHQRELLDPRGVVGRCLGALGVARGLPGSPSGVPGGARGASGSPRGGQMRQTHIFAWVLRVPGVPKGSLTIPRKDKNWQSRGLRGEGGELSILSRAKY